MKIALIVIIIILIVFLVMEYALARYAVLGGERFTLEQTEKFEIERYPITKDYMTPDETYTVTGFEGYELHAAVYFAKTNEPATGADALNAADGGAKNSGNKFVILTHGHTYTRHGALKYMPLFLKHGYSCVIYDLRGHGENKRAVCTFGIKEAKDLCAIIEDTRKRFGEDIEIGLHGESLGAATTVTALKYHPPVSFAVEDCGFADIINVEKVGLRQMHLPGWLVYPASGLSKIFFGYAFSEARPVDALKDNEVPLLVMHGADDDFIVPENGQRIYDETKGIKRIEFFPRAKHAQSLESDPARYEKIVDEFLELIAK